jgi:endonuclease/exonuclease/phosphatase family metal-dependent hydrolase
VPLCYSSPCLGGDFNVIRHLGEKNNDNVNQSLMDILNMFIDAHQLWELRRNGPRFTWSNKQASPIMVTLDRILVSTKWELKHPLYFARSKTRVASNHCPLMLDSGENLVQKQKYFFFEKQ